MKKLALLLLLITNGLFAADIQSVDYTLKQAKDREVVILQGSFTSQVDDDEFLFQDTSGTIKVKISKLTDIKPSISALHQLDGSKIKVKAIVKRKYLKKNRVVLDAVKIKILKLAKDDF